MSPLRITHAVQAERTEVFRAWTEAERLELWFAPNSEFEITSAVADARPGGDYRVELRSPSGDPGACYGTYREVVVPERLVFTSTLSWNGADDPAAASLVTVELRAGDEGTTIVLTHDGLQAESVEEYRQAWQGCLARLPRGLYRALDAFFERVTRTPSYRSQFGGFWPDFDNVADRIDGKRELGLLDENGVELFRHWEEKGYLVLEGAVPHERIDRFLADVDEAWTGKVPGMEIEYFQDERRFAPIGPEYRHLPHKVLDTHGHSEAARDVVFSAPIQSFLAKLFERPPMAFQSLLFRYGTEQDMHQDTAYVLVSSPLEFVGCWIALEDVEEGSGELRYYEGSHRIPEYLWFGRSPAKPYDYADEREFLEWMHAKPREMGLPLVKFRPKKGDVLLWHAALVHGGSPREKEDVTRQSLVTHFCPVDVSPEWYGTTRHSEKLRHGPGSYYCHRIRGA